MPGPPIVGGQPKSLILGAEKVEGPLGAPDLLEAAIEDLGGSVEQGIVRIRLLEEGHRGVSAKGGWVNPKS